MNIAITGASGFIGKNLTYNLILEKKNNIFKINRKTSKKKLNLILKKTDILYHFAAANRPKKLKNFKKDNIELTKYICNFLLKNNIKKKIVFSSSSQAKLNNPYGISKKECENILLKYAKLSGSHVYILRLPNIFGKWSKPNYNSVVSTFCYNIARNKKIYISNPKKKVKLLYIDDLINILEKIKNYKNPPNEKRIYNVAPNKIISLKNLSKIISDFNEERKNLSISNVSSKFIKNLYSTFISNLPKNKIAYKLEAKKDTRGSFIEFLKTKNSGQFSLFIAKKNQVRGHHFHHSKVEKFFVIKGKARFVMKNISNNQKINFYLNEKKPKVVESIPGWEHYIKNIGNNDLVVLLWSNEIFDVNKSDTHRI
tara:strand:+ start:34 stop:1140 length:1107 start_codon:yes stop_codon:yes gene_type:complete